MATGGLAVIRGWHQGHGGTFLTAKYKDMRIYVYIYIYICVCICTCDIWLQLPDGLDTVTLITTSICLPFRDRQSFAGVDVPSAPQASPWPGHDFRGWQPAECILDHGEVGFVGDGIPWPNCLQSKGDALCHKQTAARELPSRGWILLDT